jgi:hypothetical protein
VTEINHFSGIKDIGSRNDNEIADIRAIISKEIIEV